MSVLVFVDYTSGGFKKKAFETINYAAETAKRIGGEVAVVAIGAIPQEELAALGQYGAAQVLHAADERLDAFNARTYAKVVLAAVEKTAAQVVVAPYSLSGKAVAAMVAQRLNAGLVSGAVDYPETENGFVVKKTVFSGKAFAHVKVNTDKKVVTLVPNTFAVMQNEGTAAVSTLDVALTDADFALKVQQVDKAAAGEIPLTEAELVVSGGRGLKGPENWGILEDLASSLGAGLACSRPVADSHWRPHQEHVGQTGGTIRPNLYIAVGISGAIQHLAGVNSSKTIVVINKDPEAPFFKAADYGVIGDAFEIVPKLTEAVKKFKAAH